MFSQAQYDASFTSTAIAKLRRRARDDAATLNRSGVPSEEVHVRADRTFIERSFLGFRRSPLVEENQVVLLRGWTLYTVVTSMGNDGDEWYQWTTGIVLGDDGVLYQYVRQLEERNGVPTSANGHFEISPVTDGQLPRWDAVDKANFGRERSDYWTLFPAAINTKLDEIVNRLRVD